MCGTVYVDSCELGAKRGILCARGYPEIWSGETDVLLVNGTHEEITLDVGAPVASLSLASRDECVLMTVPQKFRQSVVVSNTSDDSRKIPRELDLSDAETRLSRTDLNRLREILRSVSAVWRKPNKPLGSGVNFTHRIDVGDAQPINQKPRRLQPAKAQEAHDEVQRMLSLNVIEPTCSPWASPIVLVGKKDGSLRFCVDYRKLNDVTKPDKYPLPRCDDSLNSLHGKKFFSSFDLESGYWQIPMDEASKEATAFTSPAGSWQFRCMPFGLQNAPATFQRAMNMVLAGAK
jgi:hypothetical protein